MTTEHCAHIVFSQRVCVGYLGEVQLLCPAALAFSFSSDKEAAATICWAWSLWVDVVVWNEHLLYHNGYMRTWQHCIYASVNVFAVKPCCYYKMYNLHMPLLKLVDQKC